MFFRCILIQDQEVPQANSIPLQIGMECRYRLVLHPHKAILKMEEVKVKEINPQDVVEVKVDHRVQFVPCPTSQATPL